MRTYNAHTCHVKSILLVYRDSLVDRIALGVKNSQGSRRATFKSLGPRRREHKNRNETQNDDFTISTTLHGAPDAADAGPLHTALSDSIRLPRPGPSKPSAIRGRRSSARRVANSFTPLPSNILLVGNTTQALGTIATALPMSRGDNILMADIEFMGATVPGAELAGAPASKSCR